ncbi:MAG: hypothetical protein Q9218_006554, partial [Villophora microphyllina]
TFYIDLSDKYHANTLIAYYDWMHSLPAALADRIKHLVIEGEIEGGSVKKVEEITYGKFNVALIPDVGAERVVKVMERFFDNEERSREVIGLGEKGIGELVTAVRQFRNLDPMVRDLACCSPMKGKQGRLLQPPGRRVQTSQVLGLEQERKEKVDED